LAIFLPALAALAMREPGAVGADGLRRLWEALLDMGRRRTVWHAALILLSPVGECAFSNLFTAVADDYRAAPGFVTLVSGYGGGLVTAAGSLLGGAMGAYVEPRRGLLLAGVLNAATAAGMMLGPLSPMTYGIGTVLYSVTTGMCYTAYVALVLAIVGPDRGTGATRFAILNSVAYIPASYMTWLDGQGYAASGPRGLLAVDALTAFVAAFALYLWVRRDTPSPLPEAAETAEVEIS
jgi:hypothetical protein